MKPMEKNNAILNWNKGKWTIIYVSELCDIENMGFEDTIEYLKSEDDEIGNLMIVKQRWRRHFPTARHSYFTLVTILRLSGYSKEPGRRNKVGWQLSYYFIIQASNDE